MNKSFLLVVAFTFMLLNLHAQDSRDIEVGGNIGLNLANVSSSDGQINASSRTSFNIGASGEYYFSDRWGIKMKLIYDSKGWADGFISGDTFNTVTTDYNNDYITLPLMANWHFGSNRNWYLNFGPYVGFLISAEAAQVNMDVKEFFNSTDFGLALGIGYKFNINDTTKLYIEYDGQSGLTDVFEENLGDSVRNSRSSFNVGVLFNI